MSDFRVYCPSPPATAGAITLSPEESHHLVSVNRARRGDTVIAFDGRGHEWTCELANDRKNAAGLRILSSRTVTRPNYEITLGQALPKGALMEAIVRKATEIGVTCIVPLESARTQVHLDHDRSDKKREKWQTSALEAAKQCGNAFRPEIRPIEKMSTFIPNAAGFDLKLIASLQPGAQSLKTILDLSADQDRPAPKKVLWLIGPEGDFSPAESNLAEKCGFHATTLGPWVLRCETAAIYALSILSYELQIRA